MSNWTEEKVLKTLEEIGKKATTDAEFRKLCLNNPGAAVKKVSGEDLPEGLKINVVENAGAHMTFVLPDMVTGELNEGDLDKVAGGVGAIGGPPTLKCGVPGGGGFPGGGGGFPGGGGGFPGGGGGFPGGGGLPTQKCRR